MGDKKVAVDFKFVRAFVAVEFAAELWDENGFPFGVDSVEPIDERSSALICAEGFACVHGCDVKVSGRGALQSSAAALMRDWVSAFMSVFPSLVNSSCDLSVYAITLLSTVICLLFINLTGVIGGSLF